MVMLRGSVWYTCRVALVGLSIEVRSTESGGTGLLIPGVFFIQPRWNSHCVLLSMSCIFQMSHQHIYVHIPISGVANAILRWD